MTDSNLAVPMLASTWGFLSTLVTVKTVEWMTERSNKTTEQQWVLGIVLWLIAPLVILFWLLYALAVAARHLRKGLVEWKRDLFPQRQQPVAPSDPILEAAKREVEQIAPTETD